jgi:hypothetical protein
MSNGRSRKDKHNAIILLAAGIEEEAVTYLVTRLRRKGMPVVLVSQSAGLVNGEYGMAIRPDCSLVEFKQMFALRLVVVPGTDRCASSLLADPRVHLLFSTVLDQGGRIAIMNNAEPAFGRAGLLELMADPACLLQGTNDDDDFADGLIDLMIA